MPDLYGPIEPWVGLLDAFGVAAVVGVWLWLRSAGGPRARAVAAATGAGLLTVAFATAAGRATAFASWNAAIGRIPGQDEGRRILDVLLVVAGAAIALYAVSTLRRRVAEAAEDRADDPLDDGYPLTRRRLLTPAPWLDLLALTVASALPVLAFGLGRGYVHGGGVTSEAALYHVLTGIVTAGPLLIVAVRDDVEDTRVFVAAAALIAVGLALVPLAPETLANEFWTAFGTGLAVGLLAAVAFPLVASAVTADRAAMAVGALVAVALLACGALLTGRIAADEYDGVIDVFEGGFPDDLVPDEFLPSGFPTELVP